MLRVVVSVLLLGLLQACTLEGERLAPGDISLKKQPNLAVVVAGVRSTQPVSYESIGRETSVWRVLWAQYDPETKKLLNISTRAGYPKYHYFYGKRHSCRFGAARPSGCLEDHTQTQYFVFSTAPGPYMLIAVLKDTEDDTLFTTPWDSRIFKNRIEDNLKSGLVPHFEAKAGEITYIGDYVFRANESPATLLNVERNDDDAKAILARYRKLTGDFVYRGPAEFLRPTSGQADSLDLKLE